MGTLPLYPSHPAPWVPPAWLRADLASGLPDIDRERRELLIRQDKGDRQRVAPPRAR
jgi:hypothetical protein